MKKVKKNILALLISLPLLTTCEKIEDIIFKDVKDLPTHFITQVKENENRYNVPGEKNQMYCTSNNQIEFGIKLDSLHLYDSLITGCEGDWNKSWFVNKDLTSEPHENSAMFCLRARTKNKERIMEIGHYTHYSSSDSSGISKNKWKRRIYPEIEYKTKIVDNGKEWEYYFNDTLVIKDAHPSWSLNKKQRVQPPWFGGNCPSPKNMQIENRNYN